MSNEVLPTPPQAGIKDTIVKIAGHGLDQKMLLSEGKQPSVGLKYDTEKVRVDLLDPEWLEQVGAVLTFGAKKYAAHNWRGGISYSRLLGACLRHVFAILRGENTDPESGLPHSAHASCCLMFLAFMMKYRPDLDDRWKHPNE
jgi:hypothetical protein